LPEFAHLGIKTPEQLSSILDLSSEILLKSKQEVNHTKLEYADANHNNKVPNAVIVAQLRSSESNLISKI
jgi:hypothetical protein